MTWLGPQPKVAETSTSTGTGDILLGGAYSPSSTDIYNTVASVAANGDTFKYAVIADNGKKERGVGTYNSATNSITRTSPQRGYNGVAWVSNTLISFDAGSKVVFIDYPDEFDAIHFAAAKTAPADNDEFGFWDSVGLVLGKITWLNVLASLVARALTWTGLQTFSGTSSVLAAVLANAAEVCTVSATAATGTINFDVSTQSVLFYTSNAAANWTLNVRHSSGTALNIAMAVGQAITIAHLVTQGGTAYYNSALTIDGNAVTPKWQGGAAPAAGNASSIDVYTYTIIKTGSATFTALASQTKFA